MNKEKEVTNIDLAKFIVRLEGMEEIASKDIFKQVNAKAKLTSEENAYLAIAKALGYINGKAIDKNAKISRDDFINIIYNYVFK